MSSKKKRIVTSAIAVVLVVALGLAGTFAWSSEEDSDGEIADTATPSVKLHDDNNVALPSGTVTRSRDIYVENTGDTALYVRVRLNEFMSYGGKSLIPGGKQDAKSTWKPHVPTGSDMTDCGTGIHEYFTLGMGGSTQYNTDKKNRFSADGTDTLDASTAMTTATAEVVTMDAYSSMTKQEKDGKKFWILDTDGYAYWSEKLPAKDKVTGKTEATGLLLDSITNTGNIDDTFYYGIQAKMEAITESDLYAWLNGTIPTGASKAANRASAQAVVVLKEISNKFVKITDAMNATTPSAADYDSDTDGFLTKKEYNEYLAANPVTP